MTEKPGEDAEDLEPESTDSSTDIQKRWLKVRNSAQDAVRRASHSGSEKSTFRFQDLIERPTVVIGTILAAVIVLAAVAYFLSDSPRVAPGVASPPAETAQPTPPPTDTGSDFLSEMFGSGEGVTAAVRQENLPATMARIVLRLALAALLAAGLAFRPRKDLPALPRNPYVAQSQILIAVVASAMMMVVADNAARAFGIFAAASLIRFRTTLRDPKEITVLLVGLGIGLATGVGRWELAILLAGFVFLILWVLEYYEPVQVQRALELTVKTTNVDETDELLKELFEKYHIDAEVREVNREGPNNAIGKLVYLVNLSAAITPDQLSEEIFSSDPHNVDSIEWDQKKSTSYVYR